MKNQKAFVVKPPCITLDYQACWLGAMPLRFVRQMIAACLPAAHVQIYHLRFVDEETNVDRA